MTTWSVTIGATKVGAHHVVAALAAPRRATCARTPRRLHCWSCCIALDFAIILNIFARWLVLGMRTPPFSMLVLLQCRKNSRKFVSAKTVPRICSPRIFSLFKPQHATTIHEFNANMATITALPRFFKLTRMHEVHFGLQMHDCLVVDPTSSEKFAELFRVEIRGTFRVEIRGTFRVEIRGTL